MPGESLPRERCQRCPASARRAPRAGGTGGPQRWPSRSKKRRPPACSRPGARVRGAGGKQGPTPVNSLAGLLGLSPIPEKRWGPAARRARGPLPAGQAPPPPSGRGRRRPGLELLVVPAPAGVAARGPAPQEGLQLLHRSPLRASRPPPPPPLLPALVLCLVLALLVLALLLCCLFLLLERGQHGVTGARRAEPAWDPTPPAGAREARGRGCTSPLFFFFFFFSLEGALPSLSAGIRHKVSSLDRRPGPLSGPPGLVWGGEAWA